MRVHILTDHIGGDGYGGGRGLGRERLIEGCLCQNSLIGQLIVKVVGFVLKKLLTSFEMLIVPHVLHCVDSCIFVFTSFDTVWQKKKIKKK